MRRDAVTCQAASSNPDRLRVKALDVDAAGRLLAFRTADTGSRCSRLSVDVRRRYGAFRVEA
ncbi:hypothetical protein FGG24_gp95 [Mycobacterium phage JC27]|uniref:Uncharacterized protein n=1 Tax=Mycobacterium phage JC27 TaxID=2922210 RepID=G1D3E4_9CAUD|nr:hypothetical protein FGG24_gp95 [Mycobacterium phage JC27]AEK09288.1 hypothetical protein PBI_JC27_95 [Mycobacterium phage JC27]